MIKYKGICRVCIWHHLNGYCTYVRMYNFRTWHCFRSISNVLVRFQDGFKFSWNVNKLSQRQKSWFNVIAWASVLWMSHLPCPKGTTSIKIISSIKVMPYTHFFPLGLSLAIKIKTERRNLAKKNINIIIGTRHTLTHAIRTV